MSNSRGRIISNASTLNHNHKSLMTHLLYNYAIQQQQVRYHIKIRTENIVDTKTIYIMR